MSQSEGKSKRAPRKVSVGVAILCIVILAVIFSGGFAIFKINTQVVFFTAIIAMGIVGLFHGHSLKDLEGYFLDGCQKAVMPGIILMVVGAVVGSWIVSGIVPTIIYYGLAIMKPSVFLVAGFLICCIISFFTGSSYTAISTIGIALLGIGMGLGVNPAITAGMIVSGALFGDKLSPFSDSTNLAAATAGTDVFDHVYSMLYTTVPALVISAVLYLIIGMRYANQAMDLSAIQQIRDTLATSFHITPILLIVPLLTIFLTIRKTPPIMALVISALAGIVAAFIFQHDLYGFKDILNSLGSGFSISTGIADIDKLLNRGGMLGMMSATCLAFLALGMGEILQRIGVLEAVLGKMSSLVSKPSSLVITTLGTCLLTTMVCSSQYVSIIMPGEIMKDSYTKLRIKKRVLSRTLEDGGTIFCFLIPWTTSGVYVSGVLGIEVMKYFPFVFFCILCPLIAIVYALTGFAIFKEDDYGKPEAPAEANAAE